jgi:hypothetical protein
MFQPNGTVHIASRRPLPRIPIHLEDVQRALTRYQNGELTVDELATWGLVLHNLDAFEVHGASESGQEEIWDVIGQLSVASVNDALDAMRASDLLERVTRRLRIRFSRRDAHHIRGR